MLESRVVAQIRRLLAQRRLTHEGIARAVGASRGIVAAINSGLRPDYEAQQLPTPEGPPARCPRCRGLVYLPCLLCATRELIAARRAPPSKCPPEEDDEPLVLRLRKSHRRRYKEIRGLYQ